MTTAATTTAGTAATVTTGTAATATTGTATTATTTAGAAATAAAGAAATGASATEARPTAVAAMTERRCERSWVSWPMIAHTSQIGLVCGVISLAALSCSSSDDEEAAVSTIAPIVTDTV